jgi:anti-anti-sigma factor
MKLESLDREECTIIRFDGSLRMKDVIDTNQRLQPLLEECQAAVIINLSGVDFVDSSGTGLLVGLLHWARETHRKLILCDLQENVRNVFELSNLDRVFDIAADESEALQFVYPQRVFLFDNRDDIIYFYQEVIQANHLTFSSGDNVEEAENLLRAGEADLMILDVLENEEEKYNLVRQMKSDARLALIPIVVLSIFEDEEVRFNELGVDRFILKPFLVEKFVATLKQLLVSSK